MHCSYPFPLIPSMLIKSMTLISNILSSFFHANRTASLQVRLPFYLPTFECTFVSIDFILISLPSTP